ncbi:MlaD family protein [Nocardia sp. NPDC055029]
MNMKASRTLKTVTATAISACVVLVGTSCALDPDDIPLPGNSIGDGYEVTFEFASAMNLPDRANVTMDGLRIGEVRDISLSGRSVRIVTRIGSDARVPSNVTAIIRQNTLLGDTYVALERDTGQAATEFLRDGSVVPPARTTSPPQVEDVMVVLANFINGGSVQKVQDALIRINRVMPNPPDLSQLASTVAVDLHDLSENTAEIDRLLQGLNDTSLSFVDHGAELQTLFSDPAARYWHRLNANVLKYVGIILPSIGSIFEGGYWMVPMLTSLADAATTIRSTAEDVPGDIETLNQFLNRTLVPFLRNPSVNVTSVDTEQGDVLTADIANVLRMLGAVK